MSRTDERNATDRGKSPSAFRTISEAARELDLPQHVLRFWETKFPEIAPTKRRGGRRFYRPEDLALLGRIRDLLHHEGYTIKGVQKLLKDEAHSSAAEPMPGAVTLDDKTRTVLAAAIAELEDMRRTLSRALSRS